MTQETRTILKNIIKAHPAVKQIIRKTLAAALEADASAEEIATACRLTERIVKEDSPSPRFAEFKNKTYSALDTIEEFAAADLDANKRLARIINANLDLTSAGKPKGLKRILNKLFGINSGSGEKLFKLSLR